MPNVSDLIEQCDTASDLLSDFGKEPDVKAALKVVSQLRRALEALDKRIAKVLPYYSATSIGLMGWSKRSLAKAETQLSLGQSYYGRAAVREAGEYLRKLDQALKSALT
mgnify:CR=1 FL=1